MRRRKRLCANAARKRLWTTSKKADKQDGGHCLACQKQMIKYGEELGEWKTAELGAEEIVAQAQGPKDTALAHYQLALVLLNEGMQRHKDDIFVALTRRSAKRWPLPPIFRTHCSWMEERLPS